MYNRGPTLGSPRRALMAVKIAVEVNGTVEASDVERVCCLSITCVMFSDSPART